MKLDKKDSWKDNQMTITLVALGVILVLGITTLLIIEKTVQQDHELKMLQTCLEKSTFCPIIK